MTVKVYGVKRLNAKLKALPPAAVKATRIALEKSAIEIVEMAQRLVPVDSGELRDSIGWTWGTAPKGSIKLGSVKGGETMTITIFAGNEQAFYARWVEFGTVNAPGHPFFFPSYRANAKRAKGRIKRAMGKAAREAVA